MMEPRPMRSELHPQMATAIEDVRHNGLPEWHAMSVDRARRLENEVFAADGQPAVNRIRDRTIPGPAGDVPVRIYRPDVKTPAPVLVFYHGGGWVLGTLDSVGSICRRLANRTGCIVVSVDYRLAPEHPFPAAVEDAHAALEWVVENAETFSGDSDSVAVGGSSAGGTLAAVAARRARSSKIDIQHQLLLYPITDYTADANPCEDHETGLLTRSDVEWFWDHYLTDPADGECPAASPLRAEDHSDLPSATVLTCGFDPLCEEGVAYAERLSAAGVAVEHAHYPGMAHGFLSMADSIDAADRAIDDTAAAVRSEFS